MTSACNLNDMVMRECEVIDTHIQALSQCSSKQVVDIGYGDGRLVAYFLSKGFSVKGVDNDCSSETQLRANLLAASIPDDNLQCECVDIKDYSFTKGENAALILSHVLHFIDARDAQLVLTQAVQSVALNGVMLIRVHHEHHPMKTNPAVKAAFKHFFSNQEIEQHFEENFRLLHRAEIFGVISQPRIRAIIEHHNDHGLGEPEDWLLSQSWQDVEYLYQRVR